MTRMLLSESEVSLCTLLREGLEHEGYDMVEVAHSYEELQAADVALPEGVTLDIRYLIVGDMSPA
jgi:DNA-binding response OmpR family regulator